MAVGTASVDLTSGAFVLIGVAPVIVQIIAGSEALIAVAATLPGPTAAGLRLSAGATPLPITGTGNVYARSIKATGKITVATLA